MLKQLSGFDETVKDWAFGHLCLTGRFTGVVINARTRELRWEATCTQGHVHSYNYKQLTCKQNDVCGCVSVGAPQLKGQAKTPELKLFLSYIASAKKRGYKFELTQSQFLALTVRPCHYCGKPPFQIKKHHRKSYTYSGVDRVNNTKGYCVGNVVPCCGPCNTEKSTLPVEIFLAKRQARVNKEAVGIT